MEGNKASSSGQAVYKCGLCSKEYYHYRELAMHERIHLNQMAMPRHPQGRTLPSYDSATSAYNTSTAPSTTLESFEKLTQPFHSPRESQIRLQAEPQTVNNQSSPVPQQHSIPEQPDKLPPAYRVESDNRTILPSRSPLPDTRSIAGNVSRPQSVDTRPLALDSRHAVQSPDPRSLSHTAVRSMPYTSQQYLDNTSLPSYSDINSRHSLTSTLDVYSTPAVSQTADYYSDSRSQVLPKLGPQIFSKMDSYYPTDKPHYSHIPDKTHDVYSTSHQYGVSKLLAQTPETYYPHPSPALAKYDPNKIASLSSYYSQPTLQADILNHDIRTTGPKSTLYYGPQDTPSSASSNTGIPYHLAMSKPHELANTYVREPVNKLPERPIANRPFPPSHVSPHIPYTDLYKGSHLQPQVLPPLPSQISPSHVDYNAYKPAAEPVPSVNLHLDGNHLLRQFPLEYTCHVCQLPCTNSHELSEHMKIHAMAQSTPISHYAPQTNNTGSPFTVPTSSVNNQELSTSKTTLMGESVMELDKSHLNPEQREIQCKTCDKVFTDSAKYIRHEAQHKRNDFLLCEFCMASFKNKGDYLHHMTQKHGPPNTSVVDPQSGHDDSQAGKLLVNYVNIVDCQICDLEVYRNKLVEHLSTHPLFRCRICDGMFVQNSELVEHLMKQHPRELQQAGLGRSRTSGSSRPSPVVAGPVERAKQEEEDSGLEEDKEDDGRDSVRKVSPAHLVQVPSHPVQVPTHQGQGQVPVQQIQGQVPANQVHGEVIAQQTQGQVPVQGQGQLLAQGQSQTSTPTPQSQGQVLSHQVPPQQVTSQIPPHPTQRSVPPHPIQRPTPIHQVQSPLPIHQIQSPLPINQVQSPLPINQVQSPLPINQVQSPLPIHPTQHPLPTYQVQGQQNDNKILGNQLNNAQEADSTVSTTSKSMAVPAITPSYIDNSNEISKQLSVPKQSMPMVDSVKQSKVDKNAKSEIEKASKDVEGKKLKATLMKNLKENVLKKMENKQKKEENNKSVNVKKQQAEKDVSNLKSNNDLMNDSDNDMEVKPKKLKFSCSKCDKSFGKHDDLVQHVEVHNKDPSRIYCEVCDLSYHMKEKGYYMYHMKYHKDSEMVNTDHPDELPCLVCHKEFKKQVLVSHIVNQHTLYSCDICQWSYSSESSLVTHMKRCHNSKFLKGKKMLFLKPSPPVYRKLKDVKAEEKVDQKVETEKEKTEDKETPEKGDTEEKMFQCDICNKTLKSRYSLNVHKLNHSLPGRGQEIPCDFCELVLTVKGCYLYHVLKVDHPKSTVSESQGKHEIHIKSDVDKVDTDVKTNTDGDSVSTETKLKIDKTEKQVENSGTNNDAVKKVEVKQVMKTVLNPETGLFEDKLVEEQDTSAMDEPMFEFSEDSDDEKEEVNKDSNVNSDDQNDKLNRRGVVKCVLCNKSVDRSELIDHLNTHPLFHCDICRYTFTKKMLYTKHMKQLHVPEFVKEEIAAIQQQGALKKEEEHEQVEGDEISPSGKRRKIEVNKLIPCPLCTGEYKQQSYVQHLQTHIPQSFKCQFCQRTFSKPIFLTTHEKSHERVCHSNLPYPLYCPTCNIPLKTRKDYVSHMCLHMRKSPYQCKHCPETFLQEKLATSHIKTHHDVNTRLVEKLDGEMLRFDVKTGRVFDMLSEYMTEIKEMNDFFKYNGKPEIWVSSPARKAESSDSSDTDSDSESNDEDDQQEEGEKSVDDEKPSMDTSDGDYMPSSQTEGDTADSEESSSTDTESEESGSDYTASDSTDSESDDHHTSKRKNEDDEETSKPSRPKRRRTIAAVGEKIEKETPKSTRITRKTIQEKNQSNDRETRRKSTGMITTKRKSPRVKDDVKKEKSKDTGKTVKRKAEDTPNSKRVLREKKVKKTPTKPDENVDDESPKSSTKSSTKCPRCPQKFSSERNLNNHIRNAHKSRQRRELPSRSVNRTLATARLKTRTRNLRSDVAEPRLSSTPIRAKAVVKISPLRMDANETKLIKSETPSSPDKIKPPPIPSPNKHGKLVCPHCNKALHNKKWNYIQHIRAHEKEKAEQNNSKEDKKGTEIDSKTELEENKPFSCKTCPDSFQKKRDLYIHAKIHDSDLSEDKNGVNDSDDGLSDNVKDTSTSSESKQDTSNVNMSQGDSGQEHTPGTANEDAADIVRLKSGHSRPRRSGTVSDKGQSEASKEQTSETSNNKSDKNKKTDSVQSDTKVKSYKHVSVTKNNMSDTNNSSAKPESEHKASSEKGSKSAMTVNDRNVNNNGDMNNKEGNDSEDRSKPARNLPVTKMSATTAMSKWKNKVQTALTAQLELHATRLKEQQENPEAAKMKDFLSKSGKPEKQNLECRICGDQFEAEDKFKDHMTVHLNESPPYCSLCNMYFMAIYPIRRLREHYRKKHPELV